MRGADPPYEVFQSSSRVGAGGGWPPPDYRKESWFPKGWRPTRRFNYLNPSGISPVGWGVRAFEGPRTVESEDPTQMEGASIMIRRLRHPSRRRDAFGIAVVGATAALYAFTASDPRACNPCGVGESAAPTVAAPAHHVHPAVHAGEGVPATSERGWRHVRVSAPDGSVSEESSPQPVVLEAF
jgi:hypothetical protein